MPGSNRLVQAAIQNAQRRSEQREEKLQESLERSEENSDDFNDSEQPLIDMFVAEGGYEVFSTMTPFSFEEFETIWDHISTQILPLWQSSRGPSPAVSCKDAFFMTLNTLHLPTKWEKHGLDFGVTGQVAKRTTSKFMRLAAPILKSTYTRQLSMDELKNLNITCDHYPYVHHITDATVTPCNKPLASFEESKLFFSGKHHIYCLKNELSVYPNGEACNWTSHRPGSVSDITIFRENINYHKDVTKKTPAAMIVPDHGELATEHPTSYGITLDKGYAGIERLVRAIIPKKKPRNRQLDNDDLERNRKIAHDRIVVEIFFGQVCKLFGVMGGKYRWSREKFDIIADVCFSLTNFHICLNPLRDEDKSYYDNVLASFRVMSDEAQNQNCRRQACYRVRRQNICEALGLHINNI
jgi:hypothetical protein